VTEAPPSSAAAPPDPARAARRALRERLLAERELFLASPAAAVAAEALAAALRQVVAELEPECLGLYCAFRSEFNAAAALAADARFKELPLALPYARRTPKSMEFRRWDGGVPRLADECGIGSADGVVVVPDVLVVPCVGFTDAGHRLGYGGGYYDRWLAAHRDATAVGVAWAFSRLELATFAPLPHDIPLTLVVTEDAVH
jgi:5,10-methenyltetrahydrofolate synthetase